MLPELVGQRLAVVDLAVVRHDQAAVGRRHGLLPGRQVDDGQAAMAEADAGLDVVTLLVGTTMHLRQVHALEKQAIHGPTTARIEDSGNAAHD